MAKVDIAAFIDRCGIRKARFGGLEAEDVQLAMQALSNEYESKLAELSEQARRTGNTNAGLEQHCRKVAAQNKVMSAQNTSLAASNKALTAQLHAAQTRNEELQSRNAALTDKNSILTLRNNDLVKENEQLGQAADTAEATLNVKGRELDEAKAAFDKDRAQRLEKARAEAAAIVTAAQEQARRTEEAANANAEAIDRAARAQAQTQAQELVNSATHEANEIYNIHQLRLDNLKAEIAGMETYREDLLGYLHGMGEKLLSLKARGENESPVYRTAALRRGDPELKPLGTVPVLLDLSEEALGNKRADAAAEPEPAPTPAPGPVFVAVTPLDDDEEENAQSGETAPAGVPVLPARPPEPDQEPAPKTAAPAGKPQPAGVEPPDHTAPGEVPGAPVGAIFSSPIVNPEPEELHTAAPRPGPRLPVMPDLTEDELYGEEPENLEDTVELPPLQPRAAAFVPAPPLTPPPAAPAPAPVIEPEPAPMPEPVPAPDEKNAAEKLRAVKTVREDPRAKAVRVVRALCRIREERGN